MDEVKKMKLPKDDENRVTCRAACGIQLTCAMYVYYVYGVSIVQSKSDIQRVTDENIGDINSAQKIKEADINTV